MKVTLTNVTRHRVVAGKSNGRCRTTGRCLMAPRSPIIGPAATGACPSDVAGGASVPVDAKVTAPTGWWGTSARRSILKWDLYEGRTGAGCRRPRSVATLDQQVTVDDPDLGSVRAGEVLPVLGDSGGHRIERWSSTSASGNAVFS